MFSDIRQECLLEGNGCILSGLLVQWHSQTRLKASHQFISPGFLSLLPCPFTVVKPCLGCFTQAAVGWGKEKMTSSKSQNNQVVPENCVPSHSSTAISLVPQEDSSKGVSIHLAHQPASGGCGTVCQLILPKMMLRSRGLQSNVPLFLLNICDYGYQDGSKQIC